MRCASRTLKNCCVWIFSNALRSFSKRSGCGLKTMSESRMWTMTPKIFWWELGARDFLSFMLRPKHRKTALNASKPLWMVWEFSIPTKSSTKWPTQIWKIRLARKHKASAARLNPQTEETAPKLSAWCWSSKGPEPNWRIQKPSRGSRSGNWRYAPSRSCAQAWAWICKSKWARISSTKTERSSWCGVSCTHTVLFRKLCLKSSQRQILSRCSTLKQKDAAISSSGKGIL